LIRGGDEVAFDRAGYIFFRSLGEYANFLHRMKSDGSSNVRVLETPIVEFHAVAPDGRWVSVDLPIEGGIAGWFLAPVGGGAPTLIRKGWWPSQWSRDGNALYVEVGTGENSQGHGGTVALPASTLVTMAGLRVLSIKRHSISITTVPARRPRTSSAATT
jgi:hypothetical protein